ncbi:MAG: hypothetical protein LBQ88_12030 [Treponema sp.]|nr:hypothetical protein [Treponema sp.]
MGIGTFGTDRYGPAALDRAIRYGCRLFDCASVYGNENLIGMDFPRFDGQRFKPLC